MILSICRPFRWGQLVLGVGVLLGLTACRQGESQISRPEPLPQDPLIQVYTNHEPASRYREPYRPQSRDGDNLEEVIVQAIAPARSSISVAVQELRLPGIAAALAERRKSGVNVRVILENTYSRPFSSYSAAEIAKLPKREQGRYEEARRLIDLNGDGKLSPEEINQRDALIMLDRARIPRIDDTADGSRGSSLMHHKFIVIDDRSLIVTSANFTPSDVHGDLGSPQSRGNANNLLKIDSADLAARFAQEFNFMWGDGPASKKDSRFGIQKPFRDAQRVRVGSTSVQVKFSPTSPTLPWARSTNGLIGQTLSGATKSVDMALFVFSDQRLVDLLEPVHEKGTTIRTLIDPGFAYRSYSEGLDMMGIVLPEDGCRFEPSNRPWKKAIATVGVPRLPPGDLLHHKFGVVDGRIVIMGSHNWTDAANTGNDETLLVIDNPTVAAHYQREFERLYEDAILGIPPAIRKKAQAQGQKCPIPQSSPVSTTTPRTGKTSPGKTSPGKTTPSKTSPGKTSTGNPTTGNAPINLNTATQKELESLPGVGPGLAKRIIAARQRQPLRSLSDLDQVSGVGPKLLQNLKDRVTF